MKHGAVKGTEQRNVNLFSVDGVERKYKKQESKRFFFVHCIKKNECIKHCIIDFSIDCHLLCH